MSSRLLIVSALLLGLAFGIFGACRATTSNEDGFVTDEDPSESSYTPPFLNDHLENGKHGSAIQPCCSQGQAGVDNAHYLFVSTMDGSVSALDVSDGGKLSWNSQSFEDGSPLLSGTLSSTQMSMNEMPYSLVPSLDGSLYMYSYHDGILQPIPMDANMLLQSSMMIGNDAVAGGRIVTVTGVDPVTGKVRYRCGPENCDQEKDASASESVSLLMQRIRNTVRGVDSIYGQEKWNLSVSEYVLSLSRRKDGVPTQSEPSHLTFRISLADGIVSAYDSCGTRLWAHDFRTPIAKVYEMFQGNLHEVSLFSNENVESAFHDQEHPFADNPNIDSHAYFGTVDYRPYIIPSPKARNELRRLALMDEVRSYEPSAFSPISPNSVAIRDKSITSIITGAYENMSKSFSNSCPPNEAYTVASSEAEEMVSVSSAQRGNQGWFIWRYKAPQHRDLEDYSSSNVARRSTYVSSTSLEQRVSRRTQIKQSIQNVLDTSEPVSPVWKIATLGLLFGAMITMVIAWCRSGRYNKEKSPTSSSANLTTTTTIKESSSSEMPAPAPRKPLRESTSSGSYPIPPQGDPSNYVSKFLQDFDPLKCLGRGGFGVVFECRNKLDECSYAIKRIAVSDNASATERVRREVRAMAKLDHPGIIRYYHTWIEHPPKGWQREMDKRILSEMSFGSSILDTAGTEESHSKASLDQKKQKDLCATNSASHSSNPNTLSTEDTWDASFANDSPQGSASESSSDSESENAKLIVTSPDLTDASDGIVFCSESGVLKSRKSQSEEEGPLVPPVVFVATETSELQTSRSRTSYVYMYIQMELCQRETLHEWLLNNSEREVVQMRRWFRELVDAIAYIHSQGLIHRDLKPQNIFFAATGRLKVGDLGLATQNIEGVALSDAESLSISDGFSHTGNVGTRSYMSPEQLAGKSYNSKVDVFSLGLIFCEMMTPFSTVQERVDVLQGLQMGSVSGRNGKVRLTLPEHDLMFIKWLTHMDPEKRPLCSEIITSEYLQVK